MYPTVARTPVAPVAPLPVDAYDPAETVYVRDVAVPDVLEVFTFHVDEEDVYVTTTDATVVDPVPYVPVFEPLVGSKIDMLDGFDPPVAGVFVPPYIKYCPVVLTEIDPDGEPALPD